jgi:NhaP-type Na+/H+ and K+/H+ antiporter
MTNGQNKSQGRTIDFSRGFNTVLWMVFVLTILFAILAVCLALAHPEGEHQTELQKGAFMVFLGMVEMGFGAVVGLLGGKMSK